MEINKFCTKCHKSKNLDDFYDDVTGKYGKHTWCKDCRKDYNKKYPALVKLHDEKYKNNIAAGRCKWCFKRILKEHDGEFCNAYCALGDANDRCDNICEEVIY